jgi:hypothetical protein
MKKYELINNEGCLFDSIETTSFAKAREYFASKYEGKYIIVCEEGRRNVRL